ncbi:MAG TPA: CheR family methyltransferase [Solirubrobacterales bacterium]|nr:CheR family methyltransferase [Solirubrobacterales bacterium]
MNDRLDLVAELVERESGIHTKESQLGALGAALGRVSPGMDAAGFLASLNDPTRGPALLDRLIDEVAVQETFFMRDPRELEAIDWHRLLAAAHARGANEVAVWVSACASGEEAYSVAMLAAEAFGHKRAPVSVLATDISARALHRATEAVYSERSMRDVSTARRERFFTQVGRRSSVGEQLRSAVRFCRHNLVADEAKLVDGAPFDLILCRNVLIYFSAKTVESVVASLESALRPGGQLILGASDRLTTSARRLEDIVAGSSEVVAGAAPRASRRVRGRQRARLRKPLGRAARADATVAAASAEGRSVKDALEAANGGEYSVAVETTERILAGDPLNAEAYFVRGLTELACGDPGSSVVSFRRALYIDPTFALAAFQLGRAQDVRGDAEAARRAYAQASRAIDRGDDRHQDLLGGVGMGEIAAACRARLAGRD